MQIRLLAAALVATALSGTASAATVVTADRYLDVATGRYVEHPAIFIGDDGKITSVADARIVRWGADVKHINLSGETLLPGLIDMHTHLGPADIDGYRFLEYTDSFFPIAAVGTARAMLDGGFTTIRVVGSDAGVMPHAMVPQQFRTMVEYGMTPLEAIQAATRNGAEALGRNDLGLIAPGRYGDLIAVKGDPTRDVTLLEHVDAVIKGGKLVKGPNAQ